MTTTAPENKAFLLAAISTHDAALAKAREKADQATTRLDEHRRQLVAEQKKFMRPGQAVIFLEPSKALEELEAASREAVSEVLRLEDSRNRYKHRLEKLEQG